MVGNSRKVERERVDFSGWRRNSARCRVAVQLAVGVNGCPLTVNDQWTKGKKGVYSSYTLGERD